MNSFLTVNNNVNLSLISLTIAPSTYLASFIVLLVFLALYIPRSSLRLPRWTSKVPEFLKSIPSRADKALPEPPVEDEEDQDRHFYYHQRSDGRLIFEDQSLVLARPELVRYSLDRSSNRSRNRHRNAPNHELDARRRLPPRLRTAPQPQGALPAAPQRRLVDNERRRWPRKESRMEPDRPKDGPGLGGRFRRWILTPSVAETRKRGSQQRLLERPK